MTVQNFGKDLGKVRRDALPAAADAAEKSVPRSDLICKMKVGGRLLEPRELEQRRVVHGGLSASLQSDPFREIRTRLLGLAGHRNFITMVVSVSPRSGGSFVARNLASAFAFDHAKTSLLIDCNFRSPSQHLALGVDSQSDGLSNFLEQPDGHLKDVIYPTGISRLRLIPAGTACEDTGEHFSSIRMIEAMDSLRTRYLDRYLFLDGPAIKGSPDACILSGLADYIVVVAGFGRDTPAAITQAVANFDPRKMAGVLFNQIP